MRVVFALMFLVLSSFCCAQNLDISVYEETGQGRRFGNINAEPGQTVEFFIHAENRNQDRSDDSQDIEDIEIKATIEEIDEGEDIEEEYDDFDLNAKQDESLSFRLKIPLRVRDALYDINIEYEYEEDGKKFSGSTDYFLDVDKEKQNLYLKKLGFRPASIKCNEISYLEIGLMNLGTSDAGIVITASNDELDFTLRRASFLEAYPGDDIYENRFAIKVPKQAESKPYKFEITVNDNNGNLLKRETAELDVSCLSEKTESSGQQQQQQKQQQPEEKEEDIIPSEQPKLQQREEIIVESSSSFPVYLIILFVLIAIAAVLLIILLNKKKP
ncbi:hypothetical protein GF323_03645 [Candidatus Woesearchaeota archaeon]|nr:hypothetical protein [Candidatus Woesearchaeota archaeon]